MKSKRPAPALNSKFALYATASAAALGAAATADADFVGNYTVAAPSGNTYGNWTATHTNADPVGTFGVNLAGLPNTLGLSLAWADGASSNSEVLTFFTTAAADSTVSYDITTSAFGAASFFDGNSFIAANSGSQSFSVLSGATFGFRLVSSNSMLSFGASSTALATISNFSVTPSAVPEPGTMALLAGCAALGYAGVQRVRRSRQSAA